MGCPDPPVASTSIDIYQPVGHLQLSYGVSETYVLTHLHEAIASCKWVRDGGVVLPAYGQPMDLPPLTEANVTNKRAKLAASREAASQRLKTVHNTI